jgi:YetA-like protein
MQRRTLLAGIARALTMSAAVSGRAVSAAPRRTAPSSSGPGLDALAFRIQARARCVRPQVTLGHGFARGDVPAGSRVALSSSSGARIPVQQDQENRWPDGSLRFAALSFIAPESLSAGQTVAYRLAAESGDADRSGAVTPQRLAAASDLRLRASGGGFGANAFAVSANDVLANLPPWDPATGWGADPLGGWETVRSGPVCTEWRFWRMLKRDGDGASHRWVKAVLYVRAWSDGAGGIAAIEVLPSVRQSNSYGPHPKGAVGATGGPQPHHAGSYALTNGSATLATWAKGARGAITTFAGNQVVLATPAGDPVWVPGTSKSGRPAYLPGHDLAYLTRRTRLLPPYDLATATMVRPDPGGPGNYVPNAPSLYSDAAGDSAEDERIGYLSQSQTHLLMCPFDPAREVAVRAQCLNFFDFPCTWDDERTGRPVLRASKSYHSLIPNPGFALGDWNGDPGKPAWQGLGANPPYEARYRALLDGSHLPAPWIVPLLRTGHAIYGELGLIEAVATLASQRPDTRDWKVGAVTYENCVFGPYNQQERGKGWALRAVGMADCLLPDNDPLRPFLSDTLNANAAFGAAWPATVDARYRTLGVLWQVGEDTEYFSPWMYAYTALCTAMEAWRAEAAGSRPGFAALLRATAPATIGVWDKAQGGSGYWADSYHINWTRAKNGDPAGAYSSIAAMLQANFPGVTPGPGIAGSSTRFRGNGASSRASDTDAASYCVQQRAQLAVQALAGIPRAAETYAALDARMRESRLGWNGPEFVGVDSITGGPIAFPAWAIVMA